MEEKLTPAQAFEVVYRATGELKLNRADNQILDASLRLLAQLLPKAETEVSEKEQEKK